MTGQEPDPNAVTIAGLGRQLEALERTVAGLTALPSQMERLGRVVTRLAQNTAGGGDSKEGGATTWLGYDGNIETAEAILSHLVDWVRDIYLRYSDAVKSLPECWLWHPDVVEELLWLKTSWLGAHGPQSRSTDVGDFHDRQRPGVVRRIKIYAGSCSIDDHSPGRAQDKFGPDVVLADSIKAVSKWWTTERTQPGPTPTEEQLKRTTTSRR